MSRGSRGDISRLIPKRNHVFWLHLLLVLLGVVGWLLLILLGGVGQILLILLEGVGQLLLLFLLLLLLFFAY